MTSLLWRKNFCRQSIHDELDAGVIESVRMLRGLVADTDAPPGARVRAATALMDRAGLTPAYAVEVRHNDDYAQQQAAQQAHKSWLGTSWPFCPRWWRCCPTMRWMRC